MACKMCGQVALLRPARRADTRQQCSVDPVDHSQDIATVRGDLTGRHHTIDHS
jgi:hypothetical protein